MTMLKAGCMGSKLVGNDSHIRWTKSDIYPADVQASFIARRKV